MSEIVYSQEELERIIKESEAAINEAEATIHAKLFIIDTCDLVQKARRQSSDSALPLGIRHRRQQYAEATTIILDSLLKK